MQKGMTMQQLIAEISTQERQKLDLVAPRKRFRVNLFGDRPMVEIDSEMVPEPLEINEVAHEHLSEKLAIPKKFYDRLKAQHPDLLVSNINTLLSEQPDQVHMLRTMGPTWRALLSDRYRPIDNGLMMTAALPALREHASDYIVESAAITEKRLYVHIVTPRLEGEIRTGDVVQGGIVISNSEVGYGALNIQEFLYFLRCYNGMIGESMLRRHHVGSKDSDVDDYEVFTRITREADDRALMLKIHDTVSAALKGLQFDKSLERLRLAAGNGFKVDQAKDVVKAVQTRFSLLDGDTESILNRLLVSGDLTQLGVANAITNLANDVEDFDKVHSLEAIGGQVMMMSPKVFTEAVQ